MKKFTDTDDFFEKITCEMKKKKGSDFTPFLNLYCCSISVLPSEFKGNFRCKQILPKM